MPKQAASLKKQQDAILPSIPPDPPSSNSAQLPAAADPGAAATPAAKSPAKPVAAKAPKLKTAAPTPPASTPVGPEAKAPALASSMTAPQPANDTAPSATAMAPPPLPRPPGAARPVIGPPGRIIPPPRPMAKAENFAEGDHVVYPTHGVGRIERIATEEIAGHKLELIHITFQENRMTLRVPVTKARTAGLRKVATRKMFDDALAVLRGRPRVKRTMWSRRAQEYEAKINSGDPVAVAEVVRDLFRNAGQPDQSFSERQIYEAAMDRLAAELAALDGTDKATALAKLVEFLGTI